MNRWKEIVLQEGIEAIIDYRGKTPPKSTTGIPLISAANIKSGKLEFSKTNFISIQDYNKWTTRGYTKPFDVLITTEAPVGEVALYPDDGKTYLISRRVIALRADEKILNSKFLLYLLQYDHVLKILRGNNRGSTVSRVLKTDITGLKLKVPHFKDQCRISKVLFDIDSKIELNNKINMELESMAKLIYDYWFVQFDFPDENGKPYKSSGGKMVYNEEEKREIPQGWESCLLGDVLDRTGTGLNPRKNFVLGSGDNFYVTIKNIEQGKVILDNKCDKINDEALEIINQRSDLNVGDILFTSIQPVGVTYLLHEKPINWNINESVFTIRPNSKVTSEFLYMFLSGDYIKAYTNNVSAGSIHKGVRHSTLKECEFILPHRSLIEKFTEKVQPILYKQHLIDKENQKLSELRDWLLPMLMNGQVTIKE